MKPLRRASARLMTELPHISTGLIVNGELPQLDPMLLRELGMILHNVQCGVDARKLFLQDKRTKPRKDRFNLAFAYWYVRARSDDLADDSDAIAFVEKIEPLSASRIKKIAQQYRPRVFKQMTGRSEAELCEAFTICIGAFAALMFAPESSEARLLFDSMKQKPVDADRVEKLREYLRRKSPRPNVDK